MPTLRSRLVREGRRHVRQRKLNSRSKYIHVPHRDRRADAIHDYMVAQGVQPNRLSTVSYDERRLGSDGDGASQKDRRAEFRVLFGTPRVAGTTPSR